MLQKAGLGILLLCVAGAASAGERCEKVLWFTICEPTLPVVHRVVNAPEIDPASAVAGLTLMLGGLAVLRGRKSKNTPA